MGPVPVPGPAAAGAGAVSYGLVPMSPGMISPMSVEMGIPGAGPPIGVMGMGMGMGMGHPSLPMHPHPGYPAQSAMMMGVPNRGGVGGYHPGPGGHFGPGPGPAHGYGHAHGHGPGPAQHMYPTGSQSAPGTGAPVASATSGLGPAGQGGSTPALPLSARFPPLPARPEIPARTTTTTISDDGNELSSSSPAQQQDQDQDQTTAHLRAALEAYQARDDAWALRMDAIGFEPARAYVAAVLDAHSSTSPRKEEGGIMVSSSTPTVAHAADSGDRAEEDGDGELRSAVGNRGFAPVLGLRLLQRVHKLEKENAELYGLLEDRLQFARAGHKGDKEEEQGEKEQEKEESGSRMMEDRAKATVELLENELQDAHALIAALSTALEAAERKGGNVA
ncbi:unnamed protein product [Tilletia controversa]|nr:hypothetical protein CF328_g7354 [Tilletia controversa]KAE8236417.1 hypothetical protein A4X03_0g9443 [Tilletia caries]CAD6980729.1 unnamed protein product [Tilletia controversa]